MTTTKVNFFLDGTIKLPVHKCTRPSFKNHRGRTWDSGIISIDKKDLDTTWGFFIYFQYGVDLQWYKVKMFSEIEMDIKNPGNKYDIDPFSTTIITTKHEHK